MTYQEKVKEMFLSSGIAFTEQELEQIDYADFDLNNREVEGLNLIIYINNERYCAKELVLLPGQTCPEHRHPMRGDIEGKQETFRCRKGKVFLYVEGEPNTKEITSIIPKGKEAFYQVRQEIILHPGEQYTIEPNKRHWFQAGNKGAVISEFSSPSDDATDIFTDPNVIRATK